jgi:hypothetical protein
MVAVLASLTGAGQIGCLAPPKGSRHLISRRCCALPSAPPSSHAEARTGLSEELPKNGDVPKSSLPAIGSLDAIGGTKNIQKSISARIADVAGVRISGHLHAGWRCAF